MRKHPTWRAEIWDLFNLDDHAGHWERRLHLGIMVLIVLNVLAVVLASVQSLGSRFGRAFDLFEYFSVAVFSIEYLARLWSCTADPRYAHPVWGRFRYALSPMALIDLLAVLPTYLAFVKVDLRFMRALRLIRVTRVVKLGRYSEASSLLLRVMHAKRAEMVLTLSLLFVLALFCASAMYFAEGTVQPDKFPDIPSCMWWALVTITTVGYGDVFPVTAWGKVIGVCTAVLGILMIALPTGVFGAAFVEEISRRRAPAARKCPHCGKDIGS